MPRSCSSSGLSCSVSSFHARVFVFLFSLYLLFLPPFCLCLCNTRACVPQSRQLVGVPSFFACVCVSVCVCVCVCVRVRVPVLVRVHVRVSPPPLQPALLLLPAAFLWSVGRRAWWLPLSPPVALFFSRRVAPSMTGRGGSRRAARMAPATDRRLCRRQTSVSTLAGNPNAHPRPSRRAPHRVKCKKKNSKKKQQNREFFSLQPIAAQRVSASYSS